MYESLMRDEYRLAKGKWQMLNWRGRLGQVSRLLGWWAIKFELWKAFIGKMYVSKMYVYILTDIVNSNTNKFFNININNIWIPV